MEMNFKVSDFSLDDEDVNEILVILNENDHKKLAEECETNCLRPADLSLIADNSAVELTEDQQIVSPLMQEPEAGSAGNPLILGDDPVHHDNHPAVTASFTIYTCSICQQSLPTLFEAQYHLLRRHTVAQTCDRCGRQFTTSAELLTHQFENCLDNDQQIFSSEEAPEKSAYIYEYSQSQEPRPDLDWIVGSCGCGEPLINGFCQHMHRQIRTVKAKRLQRIERNIENKRSSEKSLGTAEGGVRRPLLCNVCGKRISSKYNLKNHMALHSNSRPFNCRYCDETFALAIRRNVHERGHEKPFYCHVCDKNFATQQHFTLHMRAHRFGKPHYCATCGKGFYRKYYLKLHEHIHTSGGQKPFPCHICGNSFMTHNALYDHLAKHTGVMDYKCNTCGKGFYSSNALREHIRYHNGSSMCDLCGKIFFGLGRLNRHKMKVHQGQNIN